MIKDNMYFISFNDFYIKKEIIRNNYRVLSNYNQRMYKYYVYSRRYMKNKICDMIWEFLNNEDIDEEKVLLVRLEKESNRCSI